MDCAQAIEKMHNNDSDVQTDAHTPLSDKWVLWAHLPHNTDWSLKSYINIKEISASNKLKEFLGDKKTTYEQRKKESINITSKIFMS